MCDLVDGFDLKIFEEKRETNPLLIHNNNAYIFAEKNNREQQKGGKPIERRRDAAYSRYLFVSHRHDALGSRRSHAPRISENSRKNHFPRRLLFPITHYVFRPAVVNKQSNNTALGCGGGGGGDGDE